MTEFVMMMTAADAAAADAIAAALVRERLAACVQALPITSTYMWKDEVRNEPEVLLLIKTRADLREAVAARIKALHPYEIPEIAAAPLDFMGADYARWLGEVLEA